MRYLLALILIGALISPVVAQTRAGVGIVDGGGGGGDEQPAGGTGAAVTRTFAGRAVLGAAAGAVGAGAAGAGAAIDVDHTLGDDSGAASPAVRAIGQ